MSFSDEDFDRLEKEVATLFLPPVSYEAGEADAERIDRIMGRVDSDETSAPMDNPAVEAGGEPL